MAKLPLTEYGCIPNGYVVNIGQLSRDNIKELDELVKLGLAYKARAYWCNIGSLKTFWIPTSIEGVEALNKAKWKGRV